MKRKPRPVRLRIVSVRLLEETYQLVKRAAKQRGMTRSKLIAEILAGLMQHQPVIDRFIER